VKKKRKLIRSFVCKDAAMHKKTSWLLVGF